MSVWLTPILYFLKKLVKNKTKQWFKVEAVPKNLDKPSELFHFFPHKMFLFEMCVDY